MSLAILPIAGAGYQGPIQGMLAIHGDMNTIAGLAITEQVETPGLGGRIEEPAWLAQFPGTKIRDPSGKLRFTIQRGPATNDYEVDGITGATRTSNAMTQDHPLLGRPRGLRQVLRRRAAGRILGHGDKGILLERP